MEKIQILAIGTNQPIMRTVERLINKEEKWQATIAFNLSDACDLCSKNQFSLILIGAGIEIDEEQKLKEFLAANNCLAPTVRHYGGGSGLLYAEIHGGLNQ